jgi:hypothetical protein
LVEGFQAVVFTLSGKPVRGAPVEFTRPRIPGFTSWLVQVLLYLKGGACTRGVSLGGFAKTGNRDGREFNIEEFGIVELGNGELGNGELDSGELGIGGFETRGPQFDIAESGVVEFGIGKFCLHPHTASKELGQVLL